MSNTINVNGMTSYYSSFIKSVTAKTSVNNGSKINSGTVNGEKDSFISTLSSKVDTVGTLEEAAVSTKDMTMEEYKSHIYDQISSFKIDPSRAHDSYSINISEAGFAAMKEDPEYEAWVLDYIKRDMAVAAPGWYTAMGGPSAYCVLNFGATKEERSGQMVSAGYQNGKGKSIFDSHSKDSFWSKRNDVQKTYNKQMEKKVSDRKQKQKKLVEERIRHQEMIESLERNRFNAELIGRKGIRYVNSVFSTMTLFRINMAIENRVVAERRT